MIYLVKPTGDILGTLNGIKEETCKLKRNLVDLWEISFEVNKYVDDYEGFQPSDYYDSIVEKMQILLETDDLSAMFIIDEEPSISANGTQETKTITAHTTECELQHKILRSFQINNGTKTSQEYLVADNIDAYTKLPKEYISLVNFDNHDLSLLHLALQDTNWTVDDGLKEKEPDKCSKKFYFDVNEKDVLSFLRQDVANSAQIIFDFDSKRRVVSFRSFENLGKDTGIFIGLRNLANQIDIKSTSEDSLITKIKPTCGESLGVEYVNFGDSYIYHMDYFVNAHDENGDYLFVSQSFHDEYVAWMDLREKNRQQFINLTKEYNKNLITIDILINGLPNDGCNINYTTYKADELYFSLNAYENARTSLITLYRNKYPKIYVGEDTPLDENHLKTTIYWNDYYSYTYKIIPSVMEAMKIWYETDKYGNLTVDDDGRYILCENGNPKYAVNTDIVKPVDAFKYEFGLYGLDELRSKKKAWMECANLLYKDVFIHTGDKSNPQEYATPDETEWNSFTPTQKNQFTTMEAFKSNLNNYLDYMSFDERNNSITGTVCKGIIRQCEDAILARENEIKALQEANATVSKDRDALSASVLPEQNFSAENLRIFRLFSKEANYSNENIVTTNLDDIVSMVDIAEKLYQDACNYLSTVSQPQYSFTTSIDNLFAMEDFKPLRNDFTIGNFVRLLPDMFSDDFIKLRLISIELNPLMESPDISIEFSTMTKSLSDLSDLSFIFGKSYGGGSSGSGGGSAGGSYGTNDADIRIANNMLNALLNTELFGTQVTDVILDSIRANKGNFGKLLAHSGIFDSLEVGEAKVNGACLTDIIKSLNYVADTEGSMLNLKDGSMDFAGGSITYDKTKGLIIKGAKGKTSIDGDSVNTGSIQSNNYNGTSINPLGNTQGSIIDLANGAFNFGGGKLKYADHQLSVDGDIVANTLTANNSGTIAGWYFDNTGFYKTDASGKKQIILGGDGLLNGNSFEVNTNGIFLKSKQFIQPTYPYNIGDEDTYLHRGDGAYIRNDGKINVYFKNAKQSDSICCRFHYQADYVSEPGDDAATSLKYKEWYGTWLSNKAYTSKLENTIVFTINASSLLNVEPFVSASTVSDLRIRYIETRDTNMHGVTGYTQQQIEKVEILNSNNEIQNVYYNDIDSLASNGMCINLFDNIIQGENWDLTPTQLTFHDFYDYDRHFKCYINKNGMYFIDANNDHGIHMGDYLDPTSFTVDDSVTISPGIFKHQGVYSTTGSSGSQLRIDATGLIYRYTSSSKKYKHDITTSLSDELNPNKLYDLDIVQFKYNEDYLSQNDQRYNKDIIGFIAEDLYAKYPIACNIDIDGSPEVPEYNILIAPMLKLIQEQHDEIEQLKKRIEVLEQKI